jgi:hypothetical protein
VSGRASHRPHIRGARYPLTTGVNGDQSDNSAVQSGAAYVFVRSGTTWSQQAYLKAVFTDANDNCGISVSIFAGTVVIGAKGEDGPS